MNDAAKKLKSNISHSIIAVVLMMAIGSTLFCAKAVASGEDAVTADANITDSSHEEDAASMDLKVDALKFALIAASIAFGLGALGAGIAISHVGAAAMGAVAEKPEIAGQALIFVALAEGIVVFGFITALMILGKVSL